MYSLPFITFLWLILNLRLLTGLENNARNMIGKIANVLVQCQKTNLHGMFRLWADTTRELKIAFEAKVARVEERIPATFGLAVKLAFQVSSIRCSFATWNQYTTGKRRLKIGLLEATH